MKRRVYTHKLYVRSSATLVSALALLVACSSDEGSDDNGGAAGTASGGTANGGTTANAGAAGNSTAGQSAGGAGGAAGGTAGGAGGASAGTGGSGGNAGGAGGSGGDAAGGAGGTGGAGGAGGDGGAGGSGGQAAFELSSTAFMDGEVVPLQNKCAQPNNKPAGMNQSPPLSWGPGPAGTLSYAVSLRHLPSPYHWVIWDIPAVDGMGVSLPEDIDHDFEPTDVPGAKQSYVTALDDFTGYGYLGPCPQATNSEQSYEFAVYALDVATLPGLTGMVSPDQALAAVQANMVDGSEAMLLTGKQTRVP